MARTRNNGVNGNNTDGKNGNVGVAKNGRINKKEKNGITGKAIKENVEAPPSKPSKRSRNVSKKDSSRILNNSSSSMNESYDVGLLFQRLAEAEGNIRTVQNDVKNIKSEIIRNSALVWNLIVEKTDESYFGLKKARLDAVYKFCDTIFGGDQYSKDLIDSAEWFGTRKDMIKIKMSSKLIDEIISIYNHKDYVKFNGLNGEKIKFDREKTTQQKVNTQNGNEMRKRIIDYLYEFHERDVSKMPNVYSRGKMLKVGDAPYESVESVKKKYADIDYGKPMNLLENPFK